MEYRVLKVKDLLEICESKIVAMRGDNGKIVFDTRKNNKEYVKKYEDVDVLTMWSEVRTEKTIGFSQYIVPVIVCYLDAYDIKKCEVTDNE